MLWLPTCAKLAKVAFTKNSSMQVSYYTRNSYVSYYIGVEPVANSERKSIKNAIDKLATKNQNGR